MSGLTAVLSINLHLSLISTFQKLYKLLKGIQVDDDIALVSHILFNNVHIYFIKNDHYLAL